MAKTSTLFMRGFRKSIGEGLNEIMARILEKTAVVIHEKSTDPQAIKLFEMATLNDAAKIIRKHRHLQSPQGVR